MVCGFRRGSDYVYVSFYHNENGGEFLIKVETKSTELQKIKINNASVTLFNGFCFYFNKWFRFGKF